MTESHGRIQPRRKRPGVGLMIWGAIIAAVFAAFLLFAPGAGTTAPSPLWIAVLWGLLMLGYGAYRFARGQSKLDHPDGGTDVDGR